eukprot:TRINITY_DN21452_c0_g1_i1.p1 TRINITY_DN21452_c0_g1~~TRINITY_DN21452_c0_g1_i1.p1  ORF type:complete len:264 (+),score=68.50 TRINITY_DN21452_c0_g1_i1:110-901(+)
MGCNASSASVRPLLADGVSPTVSPECSKNSSVPRGRPFPKRPFFCRLSKKAWAKLEELFTKMDPDGSNAVSREEAREFFKGTFGKMSADAMFNEVDVDGSGAITAEEFMQFWIHVRRNGYKEQDVLDEVDQLLEGGAWVDWKDGKDTADAKMQFPNRPFICRLSKDCWNRCKDLFEKIDNDHSMVLTREKATKHFQGAFTKMSVDAMFNEIDEQGHGQITAKMWMRFWIGVKSAGYKEQDIMDELESLLEGGAWVDWKDGRNT